MRGEIIMRVNYDVIKNVKCFHKSTTDFLTGENAIYHKHEDEYEIYMYIKGKNHYEKRVTSWSY